MAVAHQISPPDLFIGPPRISRHKTASTQADRGGVCRRSNSIAESRGQWLSEWVRDVLLAAIREQRSPQTVAAFTELQAIRLLLINTLEPLLRGEKMTPEQFKEMLRYVKTNKRKAAADMLASYAEGTTEQP